VKENHPERGVLLNLAVEGLVPVLGGCAGLLAGGPEAGLAAVAVGQAVEKAINFFGGRIVQRWCEWFKAQPPEVREAAVADLASLSPAEARQAASEALSRAAPDARPEDLAFALEYLSAIPGTLDRALVRDTATGAVAVPPTVSYDEPHLLLQLLPTDVPPYPVPSDLAGTPYVLNELLGSGGFGAVYKATTRSLQHLPFAIKFCLDPNLALALHRERSNLERLMRAGGENWSPRIVRLYGYDLEHRTPYLVYEYVPGGDLTHHVARLRQRNGRDLNADEVLGLVLQVVEGLAFAHRHGLVHRDLKPANILVEGDYLKLADFGLGAVSAARAVQVSRIGSTTVDFLTVAERASLFRGAGTPLYMSPEQRRGAPPDPRQDLYSLGVMWFQLLAGDVTRELHPGWSKELAVKHKVPPAHLELIARCVGWVEERPRDAGELLPLLQGLRGSTTAIPVASVAPELPPAEPSSRLRKSLMVSLVKQLNHGHSEAARASRNRNVPIIGTVVIGLPLVLILWGAVGIGWGTMFLSAAILGGLAYLFHWVHEKLRDEAHSQIERSVVGLTKEFPDAVRQWGGPAVLHAPATVTEILHSLRVDEAPLAVPSRQAIVPASPAPPPEAPADAAPEQRPALLDRLRPLAEAHAAVARCGERKAVPWLPALILTTLVLGAPAGVAAGLLYHHNFAPMWEYGRSGGRLYYNHGGSTLTEVEYDLERRALPVTAALIGLGVGAAVVVVTSGVLIWLRTYRRLLAFSLILGTLFLGAPLGVGVYLLHQGYLGPYTHHPSSGGLEYYDHRGYKLDWKDYHLEEQHEGAEATLAGILAGAGAVLLVTVLLQVRRAWIHRRARRLVTARAQELAEAFPSVVDRWGGLRRLLDGAFVEDKRARLEAAG
jgi:serine/threonine protein kinase